MIRYNDLMDILLAWEGFHKRYTTREEVEAEARAMIAALREIQKKYGADKE